jgi:hypothetical protein
LGGHVVVKPQLRTDDFEFDVAHMAVVLATSMALTSV